MHRLYLWISDIAHLRRLSRRASELPIASKPCLDYFFRRAGVEPLHPSRNGQAGPAATRQVRGAICACDKTPHIRRLLRVWQKMSDHVRGQREVKTRICRVHFLRGLECGAMHCGELSGNLEKAHWRVMRGCIHLNCVVRPKRCIAACAGSHVSNDRPSRRKPR